MIDTYGSGWPQAVHPSWLKCKVLEVLPQDEFLLFDADIICLQPWNPEKVFADNGRKFCAVPDRICQMVHQECLAFQLPYPNWYVNAGLTMFSREHAFVWQRTWQRHPKFGRWLEQTALNVALKEFEDSGGGVCRLPRNYNTLPSLEDGKNNFAWPTPETKDVINFHYADLGGNTAKLIALQKELGME